MIKPNIRKYGEMGVLLEWEAKIDETIHDHVMAVYHFLNEHHTEYISEMVPSYQSLMIFLKHGVDPKTIINLLHDIDLSNQPPTISGKVWEIPVCYNLAFGEDLESIAQASNLSIDEIVQLHTAPEYRIYGMGFLPGFLYLGGLDERLFFPRRSVVKRLVPKGSVAIGGSQTGIYPQESPGGWNIIGRTPIQLFDANLVSPSPFSVGDTIRFVSIDDEIYAELHEKVIKNEFHLTPMQR